MRFKTRKHTAKGIIRMECNGNFVASRVYSCFSQRNKIIKEFSKIKIPYRHYYLIITPEIN